jgi:hypothetical protein
VNRRTLGRRSLALGALGAFAVLATGAGAGTAKRFLFVQAIGGWDPLCVFAPKFDAPLIEMEAAARPMKIGNFTLVGAPGRAHVEDFFGRFADRTLLVNGLATRSVNHEGSIAIANTSALGEDKADWATMLGVAAAEQYMLPHLGLDAALFPGRYGVVVGRGDGLLEPTVDGSLLELFDAPVPLPSQPASSAVDRHLAARIDQMRASVKTAFLTDRYDDASTRARALVDAGALLHLEPVESLLGRAQGAIHLLSNGLSRCVTVSTHGKAGLQWDTHSNNSRLQTSLFNSLFSDLATVLDQLDTTMGPDGAPLSGTTVMVVLSEMGRTPAFNDRDQGRDHWPFTSAMIIGPGITGNRTIGAYDDNYFGIGVHPSTGELDHDRTGISAETFGATLLALGDVDSEQFLPGVEPITAVLA